MRYLAPCNKAVACLRLIADASSHRPWLRRFSSAQPPPNGADRAAAEKAESLQCRKWATGGGQVYKLSKADQQIIDKYLSVKYGTGILRQKKAVPETMPDNISIWMVMFQVVVSADECDVAVVLREDDQFPSRPGSVPKTLVAMTEANMLVVTSHSTAKESTEERKTKYRNLKKVIEFLYRHSVGRISALGNYMWSLKSYLPSDWVYQLFTTARNILAVYNLWTHVHLIIRLIFAGNVKVSPIVDFFTYLLLLGTQSMKAVKNIVHHLKAKMDPVVVLSVLDMLWASMDPEVMMSVLDRLTATVDPEVVMKVIETIVGTIDPTYLTLAWYLFRLSWLLTRLATSQLTEIELQ